MTNLILQHYEGKLSDIAKISINQMRKYAARFDADYKLISGKPFSSQYGINFSGRKSLCNEKVAMLNEEYDEYDIVVVVDPDIVPTTTASLNIFKDATGIGMSNDNVLLAKNRFLNTFPQWSSKDHLFCSGSIWRTDWGTRQKLRDKIRPSEIEKIGSTISVDEGIMHRLCVLADIKQSSYNTLHSIWSYDSYMRHPEQAELIHIRHTAPRIIPDGTPTQIGRRGQTELSKMTSYQLLKDQGVVN